MILGINCLFKSFKSRVHVAVIDSSYEIIDGYCELNINLIGF